MPLITGLTFRRVLNYILPPVSERMRTAFQTLDFAALSEYIFDLAYADNDGSKMVVQSVTIDNTANDQHVIFSSDKSLAYSRRVEAGELRVLNIPAVDPSYIKVTSTGTGICTMYLHNYPSLPDSQYENQATALLAAIGAYTASAHALTMGTCDAVSELAIAANTARKKLILKNTDVADGLYFSFTNPATAADCPLAPGESVTLANPAPSNAVYVIGAAAGVTYAVIEA